MSRPTAQADRLSRRTTSAVEPLTLRTWRNSCAVAGRELPLLDRAGATVRQWDRPNRRWLFPRRDVPAVIRQAERERRAVVIEEGAP
jgi:hypothetical protein